MDVEIVEGKNGIKLEKIVFPYHVKVDSSTLHLEYLELRRDPLTGLFNKVQPFKEKNPVDKAQYLLMFKRYPDNCPFCRDNINNTLKYGVDNRFKIDKKLMRSSLIFVSKNLYSKYHAVVVPNVDKHSEFITDLSILDMLNAFKLIREFVSTNYTKDRSAKYVYINLNHTILAGASEQHLHFQVEQNTEPTNYHRFFLNNSKKYFQAHRSSLVEDYVLSEVQLDQRFIYSGKFIDWVASFSPFGDYDVLGFVKSFGVLTMSEINFRSFVDELFKFLEAYLDATKNIAFNLSIIDSAYIKEPGVYPIIRIISRIPGKNLSTSRGYSENIHLESVSHTLPEDAAKRISKSFY